MNVDVVHILPKKAESLKVGEKIFQSAHDWELTIKDLEKAARELGETEEKKIKCLRELKEKLINESNVHYRLDDAYLLRFLRVRKYDVKKAYLNVKLFFEVRRKHEEFCAIPPNFKSLVETNWLTVLPYTDEEGVVIYWLELNRLGPQKSFEAFVSGITALCDIVTMNPRNQISGVIGIWNFDGVTMKEISECMWKGRFRGLLSLAQNGYPWRIKKAIIINTNRFVRFGYNLVKPLLQRKIAERVFLLGSDLNELHRHVNPLLLPKALNGCVDEKECDVSQHILDNLPYLKYERTFIYD